MMQQQSETMNKQQRKMMAIQVAFSRELFPWIGSFAALVTTLVTIRTVRDVKNGHGTNPVLLAPVLILGIISAYQWDMAYGTKANRINSYFEEILQDNQYWFVKAQKEADEKMRKQSEK